MRTKDRGHDPATKNKPNRHQDKNDIVNHAMYEIILQKNNKVGSESEAHENIYFEIYENDLFQIKNMGINGNKERHNDVSMRLKYKSKIHMRLKSIMV